MTPPAPGTACIGSTSSATSSASTRCSAALSSAAPPTLRGTRARSSSRPTRRPSPTPRARSSSSATRATPTRRRGSSPSRRARQAPPERRRQPLPAAGSKATPATRRGRHPVEQASNSTWPQIELLESGWPNGRFYWTVVPVKLVPKVGTDGKITSYTYVDAELPQDACADGRVLAFGKASSPVVAGQGTRVCIRSLARGTADRIGRQQALLRPSARRVAAGPGRGHVRGRVVALTLPVARRQAHPGRRRHRRRRCRSSRAAGGTGSGASTARCRRATSS